MRIFAAVSRIYVLARSTPPHWRTGSASSCVSLRAWESECDCSEQAALHSYWVSEENNQRPFLSHVCMLCCISIGTVATGGLLPRSLIPLLEGCLLEAGFLEACFLSSREASSRPASSRPASFLRGMRFSHVRYRLLKVALVHLLVTCSSST